MSQVAVARLTWQDEAANVTRGAATIVIAVWMYLAATLTGSDPRRSLLPYQVLAVSRSPADQRMFRELQEGLLEAERSRSTTGDWPTPDALAAEGIPPFAPDPTAGHAYLWTIVRAGSVINYLGVSPDQTAPGWLLSIQEPEPGVPPDQNFEDEEHRRLLDGTMLHLSTWTRPPGAVAQRVSIAPQAEGWTQVYAVGPSAAAAPAASPR